MKKALFIFIFISAASTAIGKNSSEPTREEWRKMSRQERREFKEKVAAEQKEITLQLLESREWVLEANTIQNKYGESAHIQSNLNFIGVAGEKSTVQLGSTDGVGYNGVGGITVDGKISNYEVNDGKNATSGINVELQVRGASMGHLRVHMVVSPSGSASATITTLEGDRLTYNGQLVPLSESRVYKGTSLP